MPAYNDTLYGQFTTVECAGECGYHWTTFENPVIHTVCEDCLCDKYQCNTCTAPPVYCRCKACPCMNDTILNAHPVDNNTAFWEQD